MTLETTNSVMRNVELKRFYSSVVQRVRSLYSREHHVPDAHAILYQLRKSIIPPSSELFSRACFIWSHRSTGCLHVSNQRRVRASRNGQYFFGGSQYFRSSRTSTLSFSLSLISCVYVSPRVSTLRYATGPHVVMFSEAWHFLSRLVNPPTPRSSRTEIFPSYTYIFRKCLVIKDKNRVKCFVAAHQNDVPVVLFA